MKNLRYLVRGDSPAKKAPIASLSRSEAGLMLGIRLRPLPGPDDGARACVWVRFTDLASAEVAESVNWT